MLKLVEYAKRMGISRAQAYKLWKEGNLPHPAEQVGPRTILVDVPHDFGLNKPKGKTVAYVRVSSPNSKTSLQEQKLRVLEYCAKNSIHLDDILEETGSGLNPNRKILNKLLADPSIEKIIVEHRDNLTRFNFELIQSTLKANNRTIYVIDTTEIEDDLVRDMTEVLTSLCARLYGEKSAKAKAEKALRALNNDPS